MRVLFLLKDKITNERFQVDLWPSATFVPPVGSTIVCRGGAQYEVEAVRFHGPDFAEVWVVESE